MSYLKITTTAEVLKIDLQKANKVDKYHKEDPLCKGGRFKLTDNCRICLFELQSPLERKLYLELLKAYIGFNFQYAINWKGQNVILSAAENKRNDYRRFSNILTIADFCIEKGNRKICVYTDGHTYHERTEDQALRDRNIDRKLQKFGFIVLRYTGKEVNENSDKIINEIKKWTEMQLN